MSEITISQQLRPARLQFRAEVQTMAGFDSAWVAVNHAKDGQAVSSDLRPLLERIYSAVLAVPTNLPALKDGLIGLLEYLSGIGRTNANCWAVDLFFCVS